MSRGEGGLGDGSVDLHPESEQSAQEPLVSVVMAAHDVEAYIDEALYSARNQTHRALEILVVDDASRDGTAAAAERHMRADPRVRLLRGPGRGPGAARNHALGEARGQYVLIFDSDDVMHPERIGFLLAAARRTGAACVADELVAFADETSGNRRAWLFIGRQSEGETVDVTLTELFALDSQGRAANFGYMKPLVRLDVVRARNLRYDENLLIGEDFDFLTQVVTAGEKVLYLPRPFYLYRRHPQSISHRISSDQIRAMLDANERILRKNASNREVSNIIEARGRRLRNYAASVDVMAALKDCRPDRALKELLARPASLSLVAHSMREGLGKRLGRKTGPGQTLDPQAYVLRIESGTEAGTSLAWEEEEGLHTARLVVGEGVLAFADAAALCVRLGHAAQNIDLQDSRLADVLAFAQGRSETATSLAAPPR